MGVKQSIIVVVFGLTLFAVLLQLFTSTIPRQDSDLIFSTGMLVSLDQLQAANNWPPQALDTKFKTYNVWNVGKCVFEGNEIQPASNERHVFFVVLGNKGNKMQAQPILNSLHIYLKNVYQNVKPACMSAYVFDFLEQTSAFSQGMIK